ncbi:hypothetical protein [Edaphobacter aggregans]|uniref:hypothetical protein n=1 Tax=Edaphobacter aggregans TaxID=570835 RepID=UPI0011CFF7BE|nr:hypothetical protein [Edaphobacter aggregans]
MAFAGGFGVAGQVGAGDLQAVEEEAGAAGVDFVAGDAAEDFADGELDGGAVFGHGEVEEGGAGGALAWILDRAAGGVVVVAEVFSAQAWAAAAVAVGEDVAALVAFWFGHDGYSPLVDVRPQSLLTKWFRSGLLVCGLNAKSPRLSPEGSFCV